MNIIQHRKTYFIISGTLVAASIIVMAIFGLNYGIDFTGGALLEIQLGQGVTADPARLQAILTGGDKPLLEAVQVQPAGERGFILRFKSVNEDEHQAILGKLRLELSPPARGGDQGGEGEKPGASTKSLKPSPSPSLEGRGISATTKDGKPVEVKFEPSPGVAAESGDITIGGADTVKENVFQSIGPTIGKELKQKSIYAILAVLAAIILYIAYAFRKVSLPVASWKYGLVAVIALAHDVIIPTGVFAVLGKVAGVEIDILFVTAILTMLGFSVHDTIVVFDRTRENLSRYRHLMSPPARGGDSGGVGGFEEIVNRSVNETFRRSINTSATAFLALLAIYLFGGETVKYFVLALMLGILVGTYSSIFIASPLLVVWEQWSRKRK